MQETVGVAPAATGESPSFETVPPRLVDARGSWCPGPLMELIRAIREEPVGAEIDLLSSDPGSRKDIPFWIQKAGHRLMETVNEAGHDRFRVRKMR